ncbi:MAG TPA: type III secretion protein [Rhizobiales bacterium]|nr:type III secretion protein [Hyphomicrobiales bacterium]
MSPEKPRTAIALQYEDGGTPRVTARGEGEMAERILAIAREHDIDIEENPLLAQALSQVGLDEEIPPDLYVAVAEIISFVLHCSPSSPERSK